MSSTFRSFCRLGGRRRVAHRCGSRGAGSMLSRRMLPCAGSGCCPPLRSSSVTPTLTAVEILAVERKGAAAAATTRAVPTTTRALTPMARSPSGRIRRPSRGSTAPHRRPTRSRTCKNGRRASYLFDSPSTTSRARVNLRLGWWPPPSARALSTPTNAARASAVHSGRQRGCPSTTTHLRRSRPSSLYGVSSAEAWRLPSRAMDSTGVWRRWACPFCVASA